MNYEEKEEKIAQVKPWSNLCSTLVLWSFYHGDCHPALIWRAAELNVPCVHAGLSLSGLWTLLLENNVSHKALVALLAHLIPVEHNSKVSKINRPACAALARAVSQYTNSNASKNTKASVNWLKCCVLHSNDSYTRTAFKSEKWNGEPIVECVSVQHPLLKTHVGKTALDIPEWREMAKHIDWLTKQPSQVACFTEDVKCWEAWDTTWGHKAKNVIPSIAWRRKVWKEEALDDLSWKDERGPSVRHTLELFQRQH